MVHQQSRPGKLAIMLSKYNLIFLLLLTLFCCKNSYKDAPEVIETITVPLNTSQKLSEFVKKLEYVMLPKDFRPRFVQKVLAFQEYFFFCDFYDSHVIHILDKNFNMLHTISKYGEGPEEYTEISDVTINETAPSIDILSGRKLKKLSS